MSTYKFSVIIPAHNEEKYIGKCIEAIIRAAENVKPFETEIIISANRCTDKTAEIAQGYGAKILPNEYRTISAVRNCGVNAADGEIIVTIDADSLMTEYSLLEIKELLESGIYVGGGTISEFDRMSVGIAFSAMYVAANLIPVMIKNKAALSGGMFWFYKRDFDEVGGFDEGLVSIEDLDFAAKLNKLGVSRGQKYGTLKKSRIITSSRKFDEFGDWYLIKNRKLTKRIFTGKDREAADKFYYDVRRNYPSAPLSLRFNALSYGLRFAAVRRIISCNYKRKLASQNKKIKNYPAKFYSAGKRNSAMQTPSALRCSVFYINAASWKPSIPTAQTMLPARFSPVGRVVFLNISMISIAISIIGGINASFVRLTAITAFSSISPRAFGIFANATTAVSLGFSFTSETICAFGKSTAASRISAAKSAISGEIQPSLFIHVTAIP